MATELKNAQTIELYLLDGRLNLGNRLAWYYSSVAKLLYMISCNETAFISILEKTPITWLASGNDRYSLNLPSFRWKKNSTMLLQDIPHYSKKNSPLTNLAQKNTHLSLFNLLQSLFLWQSAFWNLPSFRWKKNSTMLLQDIPHHSKKNSPLTNLAQKNTHLSLFNLLQSLFLWQSAFWKESSGGAKLQFYFRPTHRDILIMGCPFVSNFYSPGNWLPDKLQATGCQTNCLTSWNWLWRQTPFPGDSDVIWSGSWRQELNHDVMTTWKWCLTS